MFEPLWILAVLLGYMGMLFVLAQWASKRAAAKGYKHSPLIYSLSIGVFCTSWTFYGSVGSAANNGILFLSIYFGPTLVMLFAGTLLRKMVRVKSRHHVTSIADLISSRYNKSQLLAAMVTLVCLFGILPYIALQLKAITSTFSLLAGNSNGNSLPFSIDVELVTVVLMVIFTILFGVRHLDPTERHQGMMYALAAESVVKLFAFVAAGLFVTFGLFDGFGDLLNQAEALAATRPALNKVNQLPSLVNWLTLTLLAMSAFLFLPRQFHVAVVENASEEHIKSSQWMLPGYLLLINIFVLPIALAGMILGHAPNEADTFVLLLPLQANQQLLSLLVFIGGFSASTGMILVSAMTLSTMITNHLILPFIEAVRLLQPLRTKLLQLRWLSVALFIFSGYLFNRSLGDTFMLVNMGLISFAAILQFAPIIVGGLFWKNANLKGAMAGLAAGFIGWFYTLLLPAFVKSGWWSDHLLDVGPWGIAALNPEALFGLSALDPLPHAVFWSMLLNIAAFVAVSLSSSTNKEEKALAAEFVDILTTANRRLPQMDQHGSIDLAEKISRLDQCFAIYMPIQLCKRSVQQCLQASGLEGKTHVSLLQATYLQQEAERTLAGAIGGATAHRAIQRSGIFSQQEQKQLSTVYSELLAEIHLTPEELLSKVDYYHEREQLLGDHAHQQGQTIKRLESEVIQRISAEQALKELNEKLEHRVEHRTAELNSSNLNLRTTLQQLQQAQKQLVEADKMAALGGLVAGIAHEINTPLGNSLTAASLLKEEFAQLLGRYHDNSLKRSDLDDFDMVANESLDIILRNSTRAAELIQSFKQVAVDQTSDERRSFGLKNYVDEVLFSLKPQFKNSAYQINVEGEEFIIDSYPGAFSQIITNLVMNSLQHGFADKHNGHINIQLSASEDNLQIDYRDDGCGMSKKQLRRIFDPFFTTRRGEGGSGLGAHIVYNLVTQRLKGQINCDSEPNHGIHFQITAPLRTPDTEIPSDSPEDDVQDPRNGGHDFSI
ncbi:MAG: ATP-binding protein [Motiliproteus sp.]